MEIMRENRGTHVNIPVGQPFPGILKMIFENPPNTSKMIHSLIPKGLITQELVGIKICIYIEFQWEQRPVQT